MPGSPVPMHAPCQPWKIFPLPTITPLCRLYCLCAAGWGSPHLGHIPHFFLQIRGLLPT
ncbi:Uncharacterized protein ToN1_08630 [Aromatoleum petrolei]|nr:Uncharacterized protein ToN1_08630 [Aromatoleum petrolei]